MRQIETKSKMEQGQKITISIINAMVNIPRLLTFVSPKSDFRLLNTVSISYFLKWLVWKMINRKKKRSDSVLSLHKRKMNKAKWYHKIVTKMFDFSGIAGKLRAVSLSNYSHTTGVVNRFTDPTFPLPATAVQSKGHTFKTVNNPPYKDRGPTANRIGKAIKISTQKSKVFKIVYKISSNIRQSRLCSASIISEIRSKDWRGPD